jgi:cell division protein FtsZ
LAIGNEENQGYLSFKGPVIIVGIGGVGTKLAINSSKLLGCKCVLISSDKSDLDENHFCVLVHSDSWINPSSYKLRSLAETSMKTVMSALEGFQTVVVFANLAGRAGTAIAPVVCRQAKLCCTSLIVSIAIMPFKFEKDRMFQAGVSLSRLRGYSDSTIILDNDSLLENNPDLSKEQCYQIANSALYDTIFSTFTRYAQPDLSLLCTCNPNKIDVESSAKDSLAMLCGSADLESVKKVVLHIVGGQRLRIGTMNSIVDNLQSLLEDDNFQGLSTYVSNSHETRTHLIASIEGKTKFDSYDPLAQIIPVENVLDWEEMDSCPEIEMSIPNLE